MDHSAGSVKIISRELIKPSSSTPDHLKTLKLSVLDQLTPPVYIALIFFYEADELKGFTSSSPDDLCARLKQSLSETLTSFYPLAGKIDPDNYAIECDDNGAEFVEARAHGRLSDVIKDPKLDELQQYLPVNPMGGVYAGEGTLLMLQTNFFDCGGVAVAACVSHMVADGSSLVEFMNSCAATCRGETPKSGPEFGAVGRHFPARDLSDYDISLSMLMGNDKLVTRRFLFDKAKLAALKQAATRAAGFVKDPTRVEVVSAFIWRNFIEKKLDECKKIFPALHVVNIRSRVTSPSLEQLRRAFGNANFMVAAFSGGGEEGVGAPEIHELVAKLRRAIRRIDEEYMRESEREDRYLSEIDELCDIGGKEETEWLMFSSWSRFPVYEVDFGWGRPVWVSTTGLLLRNFAILMSSRNGDDIEAWVNLPPHELDSLEDQIKRIGLTMN